MSHYRVFGGILRSDVEFAELPRMPAAPPDWIFRRSGAPIPSEPGEPLGSDRVTDDVQVRLYRHCGGFRLIFDDTGCFDVDRTGRTIVWFPGPGASLSAAQVDLTSRVLAAALHLSGVLCLHASAVAFDAGVIGFLAPKHHGKSTLALALVASGARLLTDDTLPVKAGPPPMARPGLHSTRLWPDSAARLRMPGGRVAEGDKHLFSPPPDPRLACEPAPLEALYLLTPTARLPGDRAASRTRLSSVEASLSVIGNARLAPLLMTSEGSTLFAQAAGITSYVPIHRLQVVQDLDRLDEVVSIVRAWHGLADPVSGTPART